MNKTSKYLLFFAVVLLFSNSIVSCKTKEGCGYEDKMAPRTDKNGRLSTQKGKSKLFN